MSKNYYYIIFVFVFLFSMSLSAQENKQQSKIQEIGGEVLGFYPNPVSNGKIYITSRTTGDKDVIIFDVLGKKVLQATLLSKELNISSLSPGVYIIKIKEGDTNTTRKLIVK